MVLAMAGLLTAMLAAVCGKLMTSEISTALASKRVYTKNTKARGRYGC